MRAAALRAAATAAPARAADEDALLAAQAPRGDEALLVVDADDLVDDLEVHRLGEEVLADALDLVGEGLGDAAASSRSRSRASRPGSTPTSLTVGLLLLEVLARAADGAARAHAGDEDVELAAASAPRSPGRSRRSAPRGWRGCGTGSRRSSSASRRRCAWPPGSSCADRPARRRSGRPRPRAPNAAAGSHLLLRSSCRA